jgi:antitoxin HicB
MAKREKLRQRIEQNPKREYYLSLPYPIELIPDEDGYWFAQIPLLPGCITQGASRAEALDMLDEAKELWLETAIAEEIEIPEPQPVKS